MIIEEGVEVIQPGPVVLSFLHLGEPCPKARPRWGRGRTYTPTATRRAEAVIAWEAGLHLKRSVNDQDGRYWMRLEFYCGRPCGPDLDNLIKLVMDALSPRRTKRRAAGPGLLWRNDRQVVSMEAIRHDGCRKPRTEITVGRYRACPG